MMGTKSGGFDSGRVQPGILISPGLYFSCRENVPFLRTLGFVFARRRGTDQGFGAPLGPELVQKSEPKSGSRIGRKRVFFRPILKQGVNF